MVKSTMKSRKGEVIMYKLTKMSVKTDEGEVTVYGIARVICADVSADRELVSSIVDRCNAYQAAPEHVMDIVYDSII